VTAVAKKLAVLKTADYFAAIGAEAMRKSKAAAIAAAGGAQIGRIRGRSSQSADQPGGSGESLGIANRKPTSRNVLLAPTFQRYLEF
jgi:hypothetical protein